MKNKIKFRKIALYKSRNLLLKEVGINEFKKGIIEKIPGISKLISGNSNLIDFITFNICYSSLNESIIFRCSPYSLSYEIDQNDISFKRKNGLYKTKINYEPFIKWYRYTFLIKLKEVLKEEKYYDPFLDEHIYEILSKNRIDYINKILNE